MRFLAVVPLLLLVLWSLGHNWFWPSLLPQSWSLRSWRYIASPASGVSSALWNSIWISAIVSLLSLAISIPAARVLAWREFRWKNAAVTLLYLPLAGPAFAAATGLYELFFRLGLIETYAGVILVLLIPAVPYAALILQSSFARYDPEFESHARTLGASAWSAMKLVTFPAMAPSFVVAAMFAFLIAWSQYVLVLLIGGGRVTTLSMTLIAFQKGGDESVAAAIALVFVAIPLLLLWRTGGLLLASLLLVSCSSERKIAFGMYGGDTQRNTFFREYVPQVEVVPFGDTAEIVQRLLNEKRAGRTKGSLDLIWINGENFRTAKQGGVLWGPFDLPNARRYPASARARDFGTPIEGYEAPWQRAQFVFGYDTARMAEPPKNIDALEEWMRDHPGRFTYVAPPNFTGSAFLRHVLLHFGDYSPRFQQGFDESLYQDSSAKAVAWLNRVKPYLWRRGETYPSTQRELDRLFANNEIDFSMSYGPAFASIRIERGEYPSTVRTFVFDNGTLGNYNYLAIPFNAPDPKKSQAMANELTSFEQVLLQTRELSSPFPHDLALLSPQDRDRVASVPKGIATLDAITLEKYYVAEPDAGYLTRLEDDWTAKVLRQ